MQGPSDQGLEGTPAAEEGPEVDAPSGERRTRRVFSFLRAPSFWGGLVVGLVALGVGVAIGLAMDRWMEDDRGRDSDERGQITVHSFRWDPTGEWDEEGPRWPGGKRFWFRFPAEKPGYWQEFWEDKGPGGNKGFEGDGFRPKDGPRERGSYPSSEELALLERFIDVIEEVVDEVGDYLEKGGFDPPGDRRFGPGWFFEDDFWKDFEGRLFGDEYRKGDRESESYPEGSWDDDKPPRDSWREDEGSWDEGDGPLGGFRLPFGELLPGFTFLEDCELDSLELPGVFESLPDEEDGFEDNESLEGFFEQIKELFSEACEQPSDG